MGIVVEPDCRRTCACCSCWPRRPRIYGLNRETGKELWRVSGEKPDELGNVWSTPVVSNVGEGRTDVVIGVTNEIWGLDPETGEQQDLQEFSWLVF